MTTTLSDLVRRLVEADDALAVPMAFATELNGDIRGKVDSVQHVLKCMDDAIERGKEEESAIKKKRQAIEANRDRLRSYVTFVAVANNFDRLPGHKHYLRVLKNTPALDVLFLPGAEEAAEYPDLVDIVTTYAWRKDRIKAGLLAGTLKDFPHATIRHGHHVRFYPNLEGLADEPAAILPEPASP